MPKKCDEQIIRVFLKPSNSDGDDDTKTCKALRLASREWFEKNLKKVLAEYISLCLYQTYSLFYASRSL